MTSDKDWVVAANDLLELLHKLGLNSPSNVFISGDDIKRLNALRLTEAEEIDIIDQSDSARALLNFMTKLKVLSPLKRITWKSVHEYVERRNE